eukprot:TRINITY_DN721_c4_g1_i4.p1 TRINITY_DN721_c4_g1~~TRINITY_DN721_c4_g1_i4.p1  ORF type:complete len:935 (-),score=198.52 TRINITY_DN721_c4_g1_i4:462-3266(-)
MSKEGHLLKQTTLKKWQRKKFTLQGSTLSYISGNISKKYPLSSVLSVDSTDETVKFEGQTWNQFELRFANKRVRLAAPSKDLDKWLKGIKDVVTKQAKESASSPAYAEALSHLNCFVFPGESAQDFYSTMVTVIMNNKKKTNVCIISNYAVYLMDQQCLVNNNNQFQKTVIPLTSIQKIEKADEKETEAVDILVRDLQEIRLCWKVSDDLRNKFLSKVNMLMPKKLENSFAFSFFQADKSFGLNSPSFNKYGYARYDPVEEINRILKSQPLWRITQRNTDYSLCPTYPAIIAVPTSIEDKNLPDIAKFRTKKRLPVLSWLHPNNQAALLRCSQPRRGALGNTNEQDEGYIDLLAGSLSSGNKSNLSSTDSNFYIMDARAKLAANANMARGGGVETESDKFKLVFLNIDNIHGVRNSWKTLLQLCHKTYPDDVNWHQKLSESSWLVHIYRILRGTVRIVENLNKGSSVLVHCSDGWDRTAQLVSLTMLLSDPHYRTINGFELLIEKEWLSFGHQFSLRHGYMNSPSDEAPIFLQFLECVWNFTKLYPTAFEFNESFLIELLDHSYSCAFGTFLFNCERERVELKLQDKTPSLWLFLDKNIHNYTNPWYKRVDGILFPENLQMRHLALWERVFMRWDDLKANATNLMDQHMQSFTHYINRLKKEVHTETGDKSAVGEIVTELVAELEKPDMIKNNDDDNIDDDDDDDDEDGAQDAVVTDDEGSESSNVDSSTKTSELKISSPPTQNQSDSEEEYEEDDEVSETMPVFSNSPSQIKAKTDDLLVPSRENARPPTLRKVNTERALGNKQQHWDLSNLDIHKDSSLKLAAAPGRRKTPKGSTNKGIARNNSSNITSVTKNSAPSSTSTSTSTTTTTSSPPSSSSSPCLTVTEPPNDQSTTQETSSPTLTTGSTGPKPLPTPPVSATSPRYHLLMKLTHR